MAERAGPADVLQTLFARQHPELVNNNTTLLSGETRISLVKRSSVDFFLSRWQKEDNCFSKRQSSQVTTCEGRSPPELCSAACLQRKRLRNYQKGGPRAQCIYTHRLSQRSWVWTILTD
jgi:hypothetical protein